MKRTWQLFFVISLTVLSVLITVMTFLPEFRFDSKIRLDNSSINQSMYKPEQNSFTTSPVVEQTSKKQIDSKSVRTNTGVAANSVGILPVADGVVFLLFLLIVYTALKMTTNGIEKKHHS